MQDSAIIHRANKSVNALAEVFDEQMISQGLCPARSPDLNLCDFHMWGTLKEKVYMNNSHSLREPKENIC